MFRCYPYISPCLTHLDEPKGHRRGLYLFFRSRQGAHVTRLPGLEMWTQWIRLCVGGERRGCYDGVSDSKKGGPGLCAKSSVRGSRPSPKHWKLTEHFLEIINIRRVFRLLVTGKLFSIAYAMIFPHQSIPLRNRYRGDVIKICFVRWFIGHAFYVVVNIAVSFFLLPWIFLTDGVGFLIAWL